MNTENAETLVLLSNLVTVNCKHTFNDEELLQKSSQIAHVISDINTEEAEKKAVGAEFKNKIDKLKAEAKLISGHITNGFAFIDKPAELWLDYESNQRIYKSKESGEIVKIEPFHASDYQKKIEFDEEETARQNQIDENNLVGNFAEGKDVFAPIDNLIIDKKLGKGDKEKPTPKDNLGEHYNRNEEFESDLPKDDDLLKPEE